MGRFAGLADRLANRLASSGLNPLHLCGRTLLSVVPGGMGMGMGMGMGKGVGVSAHRLAGSVAGDAAVGTLSSVDLRRHHPDLMDRTRGLELGDTARARELINAASLKGLTREIVAARVRSGGRGLLAINLMRAASAYAACVRCALEAGIDAVVVGAGLPLNLPDLAQDHPQTALIPIPIPIPIPSDARGVQLLVKKRERKKRLPDAIVIEHPRVAGGPGRGRNRRPERPALRF